MKIIAFTGLMGSGKTTAVEQIRLLAGNRGLQVQNLKLAQPLYDIQNFIYDRVSDAHFASPTMKKDRKLLQFLGTEWGRTTLGYDIWVNLWQKEANRLQHGGVDILLCDDIRFENEAKAVKDAGGLIIKLVSNSADTRIDTKSGINKHASEAGVSNEYIDYMIENNGTLEDLRSSLLTINHHNAIW